MIFPPNVELKMAIGKGIAINEQNGHYGFLLIKSMEISLYSRYYQ